MLIVVGLEITALASLLLGFPLASVKVVIFLPFVWLPFESSKQQPTKSVAGRDEPAARSNRRQLAGNRALTSTDGSGRYKE